MSIAPRNDAAARASPRNLETLMPATHPTRGAVEDDAIDLLANDHDEITELFDRYEALVADEAPSDERESLAQELCSLLIVNFAIREEIFYPAAREVLEQKSLVDEALVALDSALSLIDEIQAGDPTEPRYDAQVKILQELVLQFFDEERSALFPRVRETALDLEELGADMSARQEVLMSADEDAEA